jgi:hypothetical protein
MRWLLDKLGTRIGIALVLGTVIAVAVAIGKSVGSDEQQPSFRAEPAPLVTADPTTGDDGVAEPSPRSYPDDGVVTTVAVQFTRVWLRRDLTPKEWNSAVAGLSTQALADDLQGVDPKTVPATRQTGPPKIILRMDTYAKVSIQMDTGVLSLIIFKDGNRWLVGEVDWEHA